jgi:hypothetical protein
MAGAAHEMDESVGHRPTGTWRALTPPVLQPAHAALDTAVAEVAWETGRRLGFEEALELAVAD